MSIASINLGERISIFRAFAIQFRVIGALILRETRTRFGRNRLGYFWAVFEPVVHVVVWLAFLSFAGALRGVDRFSQLEFLMAGIVPFLCFRNMANFMEGAISNNRPLLYYPIVRPFDLILARGLLEAATMTAVTIIIYAGMIFLGFASWPDDIPTMGLVLMAGFALGFGWGSCNAVFSALSLTYRRLENMAMRMLYFLSGVLFSIEHTPPEVKFWLALNPVAHFVAMFRSASSPNIDNSFPSMAYVLIWALGLILVAIAGERLSRSYFSRI